jgi:cytidylate kinase
MSAPYPLAIDGPAASGKSTLGVALAARLGFAFLDTGLMYRAFTLAALRDGVPATAEACAHLAKTVDMHVNASSYTAILLGTEDVTSLLRSPEVEANVSPYSALPPVREVMVRMQRGVAAASPAILAGRDIGTVVLPDAPVKFYLEASAGARAARRSAQAGTWGEAQTGAVAARDISTRDTIDSTRATSPLRPAADAIVIDTTAMTIDDLIEFALARLGCATS